MEVIQKFKIDKFGLRILQKTKSKALNAWPNCKYSSSSGPVHVESLQPPLTVPLPGLPKPVYATVKNEKHTTRVTTLPNGLRVASENRFGQFCTVGVVIDSGSRYEVAYPSGVSHFLEKLAFSSTTEFPDRDKILYELEKYGGICDCQTSRDTVIYAASAITKGLDAVMKVLSEIITRPQISQFEVDAARQTIHFELESLLMKPEQETLLTDMVHAAAFRDNTLGLPKLCPPDNINNIGRSILFTYLKHHYTPSRMVVAGVGVKHEELIECVNRYFVEKKPVWEEDKSLTLSGSGPAVDTSLAQYTGGMIQEECDIPLYAGPSGLPELAHVIIGFEGCSHQDPDFIAVCVLNMIMGGGGSFSAGGPGKGMYTRLYTNVLNRHHWMYSATAYNHAYADAGLFCIHASAPPNFVREMVQVIVREMTNMAGDISDTELRRAKTQLQSMLLMNLESRAVVFEDIARQVLATKARKPPSYFIDAIENISADDIKRVAQRILRTPPSVAARGNTSKLPSLNDIQRAVLDKDNRIIGGRGRLSLFR